MNKYIEQALENLKKIGIGKNAILIIAVALVALGAFAVFSMNEGKRFGVLYSGLSGEDSGAVIERLKDKKIQYKIDGSSISIPEEKVYEVRMELAGEGLPQGGGVGFEIFDKSGFGVTDFVQKVNYRRALQGELSRTITQIKEIESARVHLAIPEKGVFLEDQKKSRASIIIKLKQGKTLTQGQVTSIVHLVANSSDNLKPEDITVVDTAGRMWTKENSDDDVLHLSATQLEYKKSIEKDLETRVQTMLEKAVGVDKVVARVAVDIDTRQVERTEEIYDPDSQVVRSEQRNREKSVGGIAALGVPGVMSNLPDLSAENQNAQAASQPRSEKEDNVVNYEISKVVSRVVEPTGAIKRLTVSVLVDGTYAAEKGTDGKEARKFTARTDEEIARFSDMVKGAVGYSDVRGDVITVVSAPFDDSFVEPVEFEAEPVIPPHLVPVLIKYGSAVLVALVLIFFVLRPMLKKHIKEEPAPAQPLSLTPNPELAFAAGEMENSTELNRFKKLAKENPQQVAMVLKSWIKERNG